MSLRDLSISRQRERLPWGIPVPGDDSQTVSSYNKARTFFISRFTNPYTVIFWKEEKKNSKIIFFILSADSKYYCFDEKNFFLRFCPCVFESDTVKSDCPVQMF